MRCILAGLAIAASLLLLAACDGNGDETPEPTSTPVSEATDTPPADGTAEPTPGAFEGGTDPVDGTLGDGGVSPGIGVLDKVRVGEHETFDRIVFEFSEGDPRYTVEYVTDPIQCGSGRPVPADGSAFLQVSFEPATAHTDAGEPTIDAQELSPGYAAILEAIQSCDFEANVDWVLGLLDERDFRVTELDDPLRLAVDVAHP